MPYREMKVRRKSLWRSQNNKLAIKRRNQRAAKERLRLARAAMPVAMPDTSHTPKVARLKPLFVVTVRCRDGESVKIKLYENPWDGLSPSATSAAQKVAMILKKYRPT